jgi:hypothetical protein
MKRIIALLVFAALSASPHAAFAYGGTLHLFHSQQLEASQAAPIDFLGGCGHGRYRDYEGKCVGPADVGHLQ